MRGPLPTEIGAPRLLPDGFPFYGVGTAPAAATDFTGTIDGNYFFRLLCVWCRLVCDANVAAREVVLQFQTQEGTVYRSCGAATTVAASTTIDYSFSVWQPLTEFPVDSTILIPLDPILQPPTFKWALHIVNAQAGDQLSRIRFYRERYFSDSPVPGRDYATG